MKTADGSDLKGQISILSIRKAFSRRNDFNDAGFRCDLEFWLAGPIDFTKMRVTRTRCQHLNSRDIGCLRAVGNPNHRHKAIQMLAISNQGSRIARNHDRSWPVPIEEALRPVELAASITARQLIIKHFPRPILSGTRLEFALGCNSHILWS